MPNRCSISYPATGWQECFHSTRRRSARPAVGLLDGENLWCRSRGLHNLRLKWNMAWTQTLNENRTRNPWWIVNFLVCNHCQQKKTEKVPARVSGGGSEICTVRHAALVARPALDVADWRAPSRLTENRSTLFFDTEIKWNLNKTNFNVKMETENRRWKVNYFKMK